MKKVVKIIIIILIIMVAIRIFMPANISNYIDSKIITTIIKIKYPKYDINSLKLHYVDWSSSVRTIDEHHKYHKATEATAIIINNDEQRTIRFEKFLIIWYISFNKPDYGQNVPDDIYLLETGGHAIGQAVDIEKYISESKEWIVTDENGNKYKKSGNDNSWYYIVNTYKEIYKTKNGKIYIFNKDVSNWELSSKSYSELTYFSNYKIIDKTKAIEILEKYSSYREP